MKIIAKCFLITAFIILTTGCLPKTPENVARTYLDSTLTKDLTVLTEGIDSSAILEKPYFEVTELKKFDEGDYQYLAVADFYFLKSIKQKVVRKYRFHHLRKWELYYNEYQSY